MHLELSVGFLGFSFLAVPVQPVTFYAKTRTLYALIGLIACRIRIPAHWFSIGPSHATTQSLISIIRWYVLWGRLFYHWMLCRFSLWSTASMCRWWWLHWHCNCITNYLLFVKSNNFTTFFEPQQLLSHPKVLLFSKVLLQVWNQRLHLVYPQAPYHHLLRRPFDQYELTVNCDFEGYPIQMVIIVSKQPKALHTNSKDNR